jgi:hypothetical protein
MARVTSRRRTAPSAVIQNDATSEVEHVRHERQRGGSGERSEYGATGSPHLGPRCTAITRCLSRVRRRTVIIACLAGAFNPMFESGRGRRARHVRRSGERGRSPAPRGRVTASGRADASRRAVQALNDPRFEEKLADIVGLHLNPPENATVRCGREEPDPGAGPHPTVAADQARPGGHDDP